ncbi:aminopeptidase YpdF [Listeria cornellensis FSL F6-0969]|uniref:Aminopeptidase YpdF n=1 Tax=Listeria cornellensis FSL F6-0969 TaxID=1265820 RepID=W7C0W9_9LIST|nr:aminopeptidase YpdF [Listeria cornellensis FSL F6-0969]
MTKLAKIQAALEGRNMEAVLVTSDYNRRYVADFTGTTGMVLITPTKAFFCDRLPLYRTSS